MKKNGFTLAEVLITLGIVGVVAALTAPALVQNAGSAQTGPKLAKAVSTLEVATEQLLLDESAGKVSSLGDNQEFAEKLTNHMKISLYDDDGSKYGESGDIKPTAYDGGTLVDNIGRYGTLNDSVKYITKDGMIYMFTKIAASNGVKPHKDMIGQVFIDINGEAGPNSMGKDLFAFGWYNDGTLKPVGSQEWSDDTETNDVVRWNSDYAGGNGSYTCKNSNTNGYTCAGSIFENNLKVIYQ